MSFQLGRFEATAGAMKAISEAGQTPMEFLRRHMTHDWGEVSKKEKRANDHAAKNGDRVLSAYKTTKGERLFVVTDADRLTTTILLPEEC